MVDRLWVFLSDRRIGALEDRAGNMQFTYEPGAQTPLSVNLPTRVEPYDNAACRPFFDNLLPEGSWRQAICRQLRIDEQNDFQLLATIGTECAGAVSLHPDPNWTPAQGSYKKITAAELRKWALNPASRPSLRASPGLRLSLAGAQDKVLFHLDDDAPYLCEGGAPSTVILKPDSRDTLNAVELSALNELLSAHLARKCGINVVDAFWYAAAYAVRRYDRVLVEGVWKRLHQEDFAQIACVPAASKYEEHGGPGWRVCFEIVDTKTPAPAAQRLELLNRLFFNLCLGNNDAHAKNFALLHGREGGARLAPAYDLLCTQVYRTLSATMAMAIGGQTDPGNVNPEVWRRFARETGFGLPAIRRFGIEMANRASAALPDLLSEVEATNPSMKSDVYPVMRRTKFFKRYAAIVNMNCDRLVKSFSEGSGQTGPENDRPTRK
jgi:serine/threonine-protein kinase HipA